MGRRRTHDRHLPQRMYLLHGAYYFRAAGKPAMHLGRDLGAALTKYGTLIGSQWVGRTLGDVIDRYRIEVLPLKGKATRKNEGHSLDLLKAVFGTSLPDNITAQECYRYIDLRKSPKGEPAPVAGRHDIALLGHIYAKAIRWGLTSGNPVRSLERLPKTKRTRYVTHEEYAAILALANPRMKLAIRVARITGQRRGDLLTLQRSQLTDQGIIFRQSKTGAGVLVEWSDAMRAVIADCKAMAPQLPAQYLLRTRKGKAYSAAGFSAIWQRLMAKWTKAGCEPFTFHDLRAKAASDMATIEEAAALLGHASTETTKRVYKRNLTRAKAGE
jgi:integrase